MPYHPPTKRQRDERAHRIEAMRRGRDRARMARDPQTRAPELPNLRRVVTVTDYDSGEPITHTLHMHKTRRVDVYRITADGQPWKSCGWSASLGWLRKAYPRLPGPRSDFWTTCAPYSATPSACAAGHR